MIKATTIILLLTATTALANDPNWNGDPEPPAPPSVTVDKPVEGDSAYDPYGRIYYSVCTCDELKTAWGFESLELRTNKARMQCEQRRERISCPVKWK